MTPQPLDQLQQWMQAVIVHPHGVLAGAEAQAASPGSSDSAQSIDDVIAPSETQSAEERLAVYSNAYLARLLEVLTGDYPALAAAVGEEVLAALAMGYLQAHPPVSYTLGQLGRDFGPFLQATRPAREEDGPDWADFLIDLARLERTYSEVFDGPGTEGVELLDPGRLRSLTPEAWAEARLIFAPCVRLACFQFPVHDYASAVRQGRPAEIPDPAPTFLVINRRNWIVRREAVSEAEYRILGDLMSGVPIAQALTHDQLRRSVLEATSVAEWFRRWAAAGYVQQVLTTSE